MKQMAKTMSWSEHKASGPTMLQCLIDFPVCWLGPTELQEQLERARRLEEERRRVEQEAARLEAERMEAIIAKEELARQAEEQMKSQEQLVSVQCTSEQVLINCKHTWAARAAVLTIFNVWVTIREFIGKFKKKRTISGIKQYFDFLSLKLLNMFVLFLFTQLWYKNYKIYTKIFNLISNDVGKRCSNTSFSQNQYKHFSLGTFQYLAPFLSTYSVRT